MGRRLGTMPGPLLVGTGMLVVGLLLACGGVWAILAQDWSGTVTVSWLVIVVLVACVGGFFICRLLMMGVYVSDEGVRVRTPLRTLAFSWSAVVGVRSQKITRMSSQPVLMVTARQVCFDLTDGQTVELPLHGAMRGGPRPLRMLDLLSAAQFDRLLAELRHLTAVHQTQRREQSPS